MKKASWDVDLHTGEDGEYYITENFLQGGECGLNEMRMRAVGSIMRLQDIK